jgi:hypothetical protein
MNGKIKLLEKPGGLGRSGPAQRGEKEINKNTAGWTARLAGPHGMGCAEIKEKSFFSNLVEDLRFKTKEV